MAAVSDQMTPVAQEGISVADHTPYQRKIIDRYYKNFDAIKYQRLSELATELYLAEGKKLDRLWGQVEIEPAEARIPRAADRRADPAAATQPSWSPFSRSSKADLTCPRSSPPFHVGFGFSIAKSARPTPRRQRHRSDLSRSTDRRLREPHSSELTPILAASSETFTSHDLLILLNAVMMQFCSNKRLRILT